MKQHNIESKNKQKKEFNLLIVFSIFMMCLSLMLPGYVESKDSIMWGIQILCLLPFAWITLPGGLAVYANIFYLYNLNKLSKQKDCHITGIMMLVIASFAITFNGQSFILGEMLPGHLTGWGWGIFIWGIAITTLAAACLTKKLKKNLRRDVFIIISLSIIFLIPTSLIHFNQYSQANYKEKRDYFYHHLIAFTYQNLSNKTYTPLPNTISINQGTVIALRGKLDNKLRLIDESFSIGTPRSFLYDDMFWRTYYVNGYIALLDMPKNIDYYYGLKQLTSQQAQLFILDSSENILWEADIFRAQDEDEYPSYYQDFLEKKFRPTIPNDNYSHARPSNDYGLEEFNETTNSACQKLSIETLNKIGTRIRFNHQLMQLSHNYGEILGTSFCSKHYAFLPLLKQNKEYKSLHFIVFEKSTMLPLWLFESRSDNNLEDNSFWQATQDNLTFQNAIKGVETVLLDKAANLKELHLYTIYGTVILKKDWDWNF